MSDDEEMVAAFRQWWFNMGFEGMVGPPDSDDLPILQERLAEHGFAIVRRPAE